MQRLRSKTLRHALPENALDGSDSALEARYGLLAAVFAPFHDGASGEHELTLQCDAVPATAWVGVERSGRVHGATDQHREGVVPDGELRDILECPFAFARFAGRQALDKKVANACFVRSVTSTARGSPTLPVHLIRVPSGKANQD
jgi:hypothetical protein